MSDDDDTTTPPDVDHFPIDEFRCHDGTAYPEEWVTTRLAKLKRVLEIVRAAWAATGIANPAIIVVDGYRTPFYNAQLRKNSSGVAQNSQHPQGNAADVRPLDIRDMSQFIRLVKSLILGGKLDDVGGYGFYPQWIHLDVRDKPANGHVAFWYGSGYGSEPVAG